MTVSDGESHGEGRQYREGHESAVPRREDHQTANLRCALLEGAVLRAVRCVTFLIVAVSKMNSSLSELTMKWVFFSRANSRQGHGAAVSGRNLRGKRQGECFRQS